ncbi:response regulator transcription factor [Winogradskyella echinorum]|uniref:Response regulator transcription factor n=1 Tax=Winogradskyella echinorum TaxID=538189 RepID=A0ABR6Y5J7_9FLAO|nr:LuxR C-terminal-related transcriptional regulator [Winogradskyella echinorum]MBC3847533.1 response regulator transcription factor [Winogradskyella echinorum]MBC5751881.1 response regulator transcription factor [Winogradskyella echinorum]
MRIKILFVFLVASLVCQAQYSFSGFINPDQWENSVYLSIVEDYRKMSGVYAEQIIAKTTADETGYFEFKGNMLDNENRIYRIHVDKCSDIQQDFNHFNGHCSDSEELLFIAKNTDTLKLPFSFGNQVFCAIESNNPKANAFVKIDSLKNDMRFAYGEFRSEANRKLNNKKWFKALQSYGEALNEPIAELYIYSYLSDRSSDLHNYYVEDLKNNSYYDGLKTRLKTSYPKASYTKQYTNELEADRYMLTASAGKTGLHWSIYLYAILAISFILNAILLYQMWKRKQSKTRDLKNKLSKQEQIVLEYLLDDKTNKDIAEALFLSVSTVKTHTNNIYKKLNVQSRSDAKSLFIK